MIIEYHPSVYEPLLTIIAPRFESVRHLFPSWCHKVYVYYDPDPSEGAMISVQPRYEYRSMNVIATNLFIEDTHNWELALFHEIQHGLIRPYTARVERVLSKFITDETILEYLRDELLEAEESCVQDLAIFACKLSNNVVD